MKSRLATLIERESCDRVYLTGTLGDAVILIEQDGTARDGARRWRLMLATPDKPEAGKERQAANRRGAAWRIQRRKAEGVEAIGGND